MIADILTYIDSYDNIRAVCGLNRLELPDTTLALSLYRNKLGMVMGNIVGVYTPSTADETLQEIFDRLLTTDEFYPVLQQYAIYVVADEVMNSVGLRAFKTQADGKSNLTRFSPESTYLGTRKAIKDGINELLSLIYGFLDTAEEALEYMTVVTPDVDLVVGE